MRNDDDQSPDPWTRISTVRCIERRSSARGRRRDTPNAEAQTSNPIVTENALPGSPQNEWDIQGSGESTLQGFATGISVNKGSVVSFKIKTSAPGFCHRPYPLGPPRVSGARKVATVTPTATQIAAAQNQPACLTDAQSGLVDCGNWAVAGTGTHDGG